MPQNSVSALLCKLKLHTESTVTTEIKVNTIKNISIKMPVHSGNFCVWRPE